MNSIIDFFLPARKISTWYNIYMPAGAFSQPKYLIYTSDCERVKLSLILEIFSYRKTQLSL